MGRKYQYQITVPLPNMKMFFQTCRAKSKKEATLYFALCKFPILAGCLPKQIYNLVRRRYSNKEQLAISRARTKSISLNRTKDLEKQVIEQHDKYLRIAADFSNFQKRVRQELMRVTSQERARILREILPVLDSYESAQSLHDSGPALQASLACLKQLHSIMVSLGISPMISICKFDPSLHNAISKRRDDSKENGVILEVAAKGYYYDNDKILRPAKVVVNDLPKGFINAAK